jgi:hypothetical protein
VAHELAHAVVLWAFFRHRAHISVRPLTTFTRPHQAQRRIGGYAELSGWSGPPPTVRDLRRFVLAILAGPAVSLAFIAVLAPLTVRFWSTGSEPSFGEAFRLMLVGVPLIIVTAGLARAGRPGHDLELARRVLAGARGLADR